MSHSLLCDSNKSLSLKRICEGLVRRTHSILEILPYNTQALKSENTHLIWVCQGMRAKFYHWVTTSYLEWLNTPAIFVFLIKSHFLLTAYISLILKPKWQWHHDCANIFSPHFTLSKCKLLKCKPSVVHAQVKAKMRCAEDETIYMCSSFFRWVTWYHRNDNEVNQSHIHGAWELAGGPVRPHDTHVITLPFPVVALPLNWNLR